ncbi:SHOCT domain-containing protein [Microbacterium sp. 2FI]|uniref:SHOCT domain-containing protein n=1 Tax=Microbacterium sp. 2FI TaxID=2502193 RepID=UPI0010F93424|nr:SHOCT domain-containing protein [Microbacterium sp. 2FI]
MPLGRRGRPGLIGMAARTAVVAGTATAVSGSVARHQQEKAYNSQQEQAYAAQQQQAAMDAAAAQAVANAQAAAPPPPPAPAPAAAAPADDMMAKLTQLATLHSQGILSDDEFAAAKAKLLG